MHSVLTCCGTKYRFRRQNCKFQWVGPACGSLFLRHLNSHHNETIIRNFYLLPDIIEMKD